MTARGRLTQFCSTACWQATILPRFIPAVCENPGCQAPFTARYDHGRYTRFCRQACWMAVCPHPGGSGHWNWTDEPSYVARHKRLHKVRGSARDHQCGHCDRQASEWAQIHGTAGTDPANYIALCTLCHMRYDGHVRNLSVPPQPGERNPAAKLTWAKVREIRALHGAASAASIAREYGVSDRTISRIWANQSWREPPTSAKRGSE
jgi:hypothetical protein